MNQTDWMIFFLYDQLSIFLQASISKVDYLAYEYYLDPYVLLIPFDVLDQIYLIQL